MKKLLLLLIIPFLSFGQRGTTESYNLIKDNVNQSLDINHMLNEPDYWHTLKYTEDDSTFWSNVDNTKLFISSLKESACL